MKFTDNTPINFTKDYFTKCWRFWICLFLILTGTATYIYYVLGQVCFFFFIIIWLSFYIAVSKYIEDDARYYAPIFGLLAGLHSLATLKPSLESAIILICIGAIYLLFDFASSYSMFIADAEVKAPLTPKEGYHWNKLNNELFIAPSLLLTNSCIRIVSWRICGVGLFFLILMPILTILLVLSFFTIVWFIPVLLVWYFMGRELLREKFHSVKISVHCDSVILTKKTFSLGSIFKKCLFFRNVAISKVQEFNLFFFRAVQIIKYTYDKEVTYRHHTEEKTCVAYQVNFVLNKGVSVPVADFNSRKKALKLANYLSRGLSVPVCTNFD